MSDAVEDSKECANFLKNLDRLCLSIPPRHYSNLEIKVSLKNALDLCNVKMLRLILVHTVLILHASRSINAVMPLYINHCYLTK